MKNSRSFLFILICIAVSISVHSQTATQSTITYDLLKHKRIYRLGLSNKSYLLELISKDSFAIFYNFQCVEPAIKTDSGKFAIKNNTILLTNKTGKTYAFVYKEFPAATVLVNGSIANNPANNKTKQLPLEDVETFLSGKDPLDNLFYFELR
ncbi:hypothetical protein [Ferruginibacter sp.]